MKLNRKLVMILALVLSLAMATGGTLAYLTDRESIANVFTVGDVKIQLTEEFEQEKQMLPGVSIKKIPTITNIGANNAWVWLTVSVPKALANVIDLEGVETAGDWTLLRDAATEEIGGINYTTYTMLYGEALANGETATNALTAVTLDPSVDIDPTGAWFTVTNGTPATLNWTNANGNPRIYVGAYAIQQEKFTTVEDAYAAYRGQWGDKGTDYGLSVATEDALVTALNAGQKVLLTADITLSNATTVPGGAEIDLGGHTLYTKGLTFTGDATIENGTIKSSANTSMVPHFMVGDGDLAMDNVLVDIDHYLNYGASGNATVGELQGVEIKNGNAVLNNCAVKVNTDVDYTFTYIYTVTVNNGSLTMNGGSIEATCPGDPNANDYIVAISGVGDSTATLNNVEINADSLGLTMGDLVINTTDHTATADDVRTFINRDTGLPSGTAKVNHI